jgi:hypothetical protein
VFRQIFWIKILKIISTLDFLFDYFSDQTPFSHIEQVFSFLILAQQRSEENLATYYFFKAVFDLICRMDNNSIFLASSMYRQIFTMSLQIFKEKSVIKDDLLILELNLMLIEYITFLT